MKINWKLRLRNKTWLAAVIATVVTFLFDMMNLLGVVPPIAEDAVLTALSALCTLLAALGVVIDPTTPGVADADEVMEEEA